MSIEDMIRQAANRHGIDPNLALAVARAESNLNQQAVSRAGAIGVFQLMPKTAAWLGVDPYNLAENIEGGVKYLAQLAQSYAGNLRLILGAYNWGPGNLAEAIARWGNDWLAHAPLETRNYLPKIFSSLGLPWGTDTPPGAPGAPGSGDTLAMILLGAALFLLLLD